MSRAEVSKVTPYAVLGPPPAAAAVSKLTVYVVLVPGDDGTQPATSRQGHVYGQTFRRP